ncbi:MAG: hypothetical protein AAGD92_00750 [Pseudomonadota bacterium]
MLAVNAELIVGAAFALVIIISVIESVGHIVLSMGRIFAGRMGDWRATPVFRLVVILLAGYFTSTGFNQNLPFAGEITAVASLLYVLIPVSFVVETYARTSFRPLSISFAATLLSIVALPAAGYTLVPFHKLLGHGEDQVATQSADIAGGAVIEQDVFDPTSLLEEHFFEIDVSTECSAALDNFNLGQPSSEVEDRDQYLLFWIDQTARGLLLDVPEVYGCQLSKYAHDPDSFAIATVVAGYRFLVSVITVAIVLAPFGHRRALSQEME